MRLLLLSTLLLTASGLAALPLRFSVDLEESWEIDDNVFRLSDPDIDRLDGTPSFQPDAAGPQDLRMDHRVLAFAYHDLPGKRSGRLRAGLDAKVVTHADNRMKNYHTARFSLDWQRRPGWGIEASWFALRNFYLREYTDGDTGQIRGADFDSDELRLRARMRFPGLGLVSRPTLYLHVLGQNTYYNAWFSEYDTEAIEWGLRLSATLPLGLSASAGYSFVDTDNVGYRSPVFTLADEDSEVGDGTNQEDQWRLSLDWEGRLLGEELGLGLSFTWRHREYQTDLPLLEDPVHSGRSDDRYVLRLDKSWQITKALSLRPYLEREWRSVESAWPSMRRLKEFDARRLGLVLRWSVL